MSRPMRLLAVVVVLVRFVVPAWTQEVGQPDAGQPQILETIRTSLLHPVLGFMNNYWAGVVEYEVVRSARAGVVFGCYGAWEQQEDVESSLLAPMFGYNIYPLSTAPHGWFIGLNGELWVRTLPQTWWDEYLGELPVSIRMLALSLRTGYEFVIGRSFVARAHLGVTAYNDFSTDPDVDVRIGWSRATRMERTPRPRPPAPNPDELGTMASDPVKFPVGASVGFLQPTLEAPEGSENRWQAGPAAPGAGAFGGVIIRAGYYLSIGAVVNVFGYIDSPGFSVGPELMLMIHPPQRELAFVVGSGPLIADSSISNTVRLGVSYKRHLISARWSIGINGGGHGGALSYAFVL